MGPGTRMPRLPALYRPKRRWRLEEQRGPLNYLEDEQQSENPSRRQRLACQTKVEEDQVTHGGRCSSEVSTNGVVTRRVLRDGNNGLAVNTRTRIRDQERSDRIGLETNHARKVGHAHIRADSGCERSTQASANSRQRLEVPRVSSARRWTRWDFRHQFSFILLEQSTWCYRSSHAVFGGPLVGDLAHAVSEKLFVVVGRSQLVRWRARPSC